MSLDQIYLKIYQLIFRAFQILNAHHLLQIQTNLVQGNLLDLP